MQYTILCLGASVFAAFAHAQAPTNPLFFSTMPKQDEELLIGKPITVDYKSPQPAAVKITLLRGAPSNNYPYKVLSTTATGGTYSFTPDTSYPIACDYGLQIDQAGSPPNYSTHFCIASDTVEADVKTSTSVSSGVTKTTHITTYVTSTVTSTTSTPEASSDTTCTTSSLTSTVTTAAALPVDTPPSSIIATSYGAMGPGAPPVQTSIVTATPVAASPTPAAGTPAATPQPFTPGSGAASLVASGCFAGVVAVVAGLALF